MAHTLKASSHITLLNLDCKNEWDIKVEGTNIVLTEMTGDVRGHSYILQFDCETKLDAFQNAVTCVNHNWDTAIKRDRDARIARLKELSDQVSEELRDYVELYGMPETMKIPFPQASFEVVDYANLPDAVKQVIDKVVGNIKP